jgi:hypothetical protein
MQITLGSSSRRLGESLITKAKTLVNKGKVGAAEVDGIKQCFSLEYGPEEVREYCPPGSGAGN